MCRCVVRSGYKDTYGSGDEDEFENELLYNLSEFIQTEGSAPWIASSNEMSLDGRMTAMGALGASFAASNTGLSLPLSETQTERENTYNFNFNADSLEVSPSTFTCCNLLQPSANSHDDLVGFST